MIHNINNLQNPTDISFDKYSEEQIIQALANSGQRLGIKGDGISYKDFTFAELCGEEISYDINKDIGFIKYSRDNSNSQYKGIFGITDKATLSDERIFAENLNINNTLFFPTDISFDIFVNGIDKYSKNSICVNDGNEITYIFAGGIIGSSVTDKHNVLLEYAKYNVRTNKLKYYNRIYEYQLNNKDVIAMVVITNKEYEENNYRGEATSNNYKMHLYIYNPEYFENQAYVDELYNLFKKSSYNITGDIPFSIIKPEYVNIIEMLKINNADDAEITRNSIASIIYNASAPALYFNASFDLSYNSSDNTHLSILKQTSSIIDRINYIEDEYVINVFEEIDLANNDINIVYHNLFNYYNTKLYLDSRTTFIKRVLLNLYEYVSDKNYESSYYLYIPLDYKFHYICNSNKPLNIYYSNDLYVTYTKINKLLLDDFWESNTNMVFDYNGVDKVKCVNFEITYNLEYEDLINIIEIKQVYTMPYINANNNWSINDKDSNIYAIGKNAGNPNIIVINSKSANDEDYDVLSSSIIDKEDILKKTVYKKHLVTLNPLTFNESNVSEDIKCYVWVPEIDSNNYDYFKYSIIIGIANLECLTNIDWIEKYKGSYIITMWTIKYDEDTQTYYYDYIKQTDYVDPTKQYAIALGTTVNIAEVSNKSNTEVLDSKDIFILKAPITAVGHSTSNVDPYDYVTIKSKKSEEYQNEDEVIQYYNDLNLNIQYNKNITNDDGKVVIEKQNDKYLDISKDMDYTYSFVTNELYPQYNVSKNPVSSETVVSYIQDNPNDPAVNNIITSNISVNGTTITNIDKLVEVLSETEEVNAETEALKNQIIISATSNYYNEYVFNTNVPSLDLSELLSRNVNILNRVNILSLSNEFTEDNKPKIYNAYIGTSYNESNKSILHIGTSDTNINLGTDTLTNEETKHSLSTHNGLSLDFDKLIFNSKNIESLGYNVNKKVIDEITYYYGTLSFGKRTPELDKKCIFIKLNDDNNLSGLIYDVLQRETFYDSTVIDLNQLMLDIFNEDLTTYDNDKINVTCNKISTDEIVNNRLNVEYIGQLVNIGDNNHYFVFNEYSGFYLIQDKINNGTIAYLNTPLNIMYYTSSIGSKTINIYITMR